MGMRKLTVGFAVSLVIAGCGGGGGTDNSDKSVATAMQQSSKLPVITMNVSRSEINPAQSSILTWNVSDATSCTGSNAWSGSIALSGNKIISYIEGSQKFELSCSNSTGTSTRNITVNGKQPTLTFAGAWYPVATQSLKDGYDGSIVGSFYNLVKIGSQEKYGLVMTGWGFKGWNSNSKETATVKVALFEQDEKGLMNIATNKYISDSNSYGGASVITTDINKDSYQDIVLISHNETPILPNPSIILYGSAIGTFQKKITKDEVAAHDARLVTTGGTEKIFTSVVNGHPRNAYYEFSNGYLNPTYTPSISYYNTNFTQFGNMSQTIVENKDGVRALVTAGGCKEPTGTCYKTINIFPFDGYDISQTHPNQSITPYLNTLSKFANSASIDGTGQAHVYRVWSIDLNNDDNTDILSAQAMWIENKSTLPVALQILQNKGNNTFVDRTEILNLSMPNEQSMLDNTPLFLDIDSSGIETLFFASIAFNNTSYHSNYVLLNDGTGKLYVGLHDEFEYVANNIFNILLNEGFKFTVSNPTKSFMMPKFIAIPQNDGSVNFLAEVKTTAKNNENGMVQSVHLFVNVPFNYNPNVDYTNNVTVQDRNKSNKIRTWAGDDTINDQNAVIGTKIDGGLGKNKVTYSSASTNYSVTKNSDGSYRVTNSTNNIDDTLTRIHNIVFTDKTITLE